MHGALVANQATVQADKAGRAALCAGWQDVIIVIPERFEVKPGPEKSLA